MKTGVKRFNNSLSDKFLDLINDNFKKKLLKANLMRRKKRQQNEERKGDGPEDRVELSQQKWSAPSFQRFHFEYLSKYIFEPYPKSNVK